MEYTSEGAAKMQLLTRAEVEERVGLRRSAIYAMMRAGRFPEPVKISSRCVRWRSDEVQAWIDGLPRARGEAA